MKAQKKTQTEIQLYQSLNSPSYNENQNDNQFIKVLPLFLASYPSPHTREVYKKAVHEFLDFWQEKEIFLATFQELQRFHLDGWQRALESTTKLSPASISTKVSAIISLSRFLMENGWIEKNPGEFVKLPKISKQKGKTQALSQNEITLILENLRDSCTKATRPSYVKKDYQAWFRYGVFLTMATVGMRCSEFVNLKISDFEKKGNYYRLHLNLKGGEEHSPLIPTYLSDFILQFIKKCRNFAKPTDPLFPLSPQSNEKIKREYLSKIITKVAKDHGVEQKISAHSLRATVASLLHKSNTPVGEIKDLLGHKSIMTTMMYVRKTDE